LLEKSFLRFTYILRTLLGENFVIREGVGTSYPCIHVYRRTNNYYIVETIGKRYEVSTDLEHFFCYLLAKIPNLFRDFIIQLLPQFRTIHTFQK
jgi:hypothetical protein